MTMAIYRPLGRIRLEVCVAAAAAGINCFANVDGYLDFRLHDGWASTSGHVATLPEWNRVYTPGAQTLK
jgi:hypothetical protein